MSQDTCQLRFCKHGNEPHIYTTFPIHDWYQLQSISQVMKLCKYYFRIWSSF